MGITRGLQNLLDRPRARISVLGRILDLSLEIQRAELEVGNTLNSEFPSPSHPNETHTDDLRCLQEITYLTSPGALNPIPNRPPITDLDQTSPKTGSVEPLPERPTKSLPTRSLPSKSESEVKKEDQSTTDQTSSIAIKEEPLAPPTSGEAQNKPHSPTLTDAPPAKSHLSNVETSAKPPASPLVRTKGLPEPDTSSTGSDTAHQEQTNQIMTAIYRPESKATWLEQLRTANEKRSGTVRAISRPEIGESDTDETVSRQQCPQQASSIRG
jgi:striatin 1/3/4